MARLIVCFALVLSVVSVYGLGLIGKDDVVERNVRAARTTMKPNIRRITTPKSYKCASPTEAPFKDYNKNCCNVQTNDFFKNSTKYACNKQKKDDILFKYTLEYMLQEHQEQTNGNKINWAKDSVVKALGKPACFMECIFKELDLLKSDKKNVDDDKLKTQLESMVHAEWKDAVTAANTYCKDYVVDTVFTPTTINNNVDKPPVTCNLLPLAWVQCIRYKIIGDCKPAQEPANPKALCAVGANAQDNCNTVFTTTVAPGRR